MIEIHCILLILSIFLSLAKRKKPLISPVIVFIYFYSIVIIFSTLYHYYYPYNDKINLFGLDYISDKRFLETFCLFSYLIIFFCLGNFLYRLLIPKYNILINSKIQFTIFNKSKNFNSKPFEKWLVIVMTIMISLYAILLGGNFFSRDAYLDTESNLMFANQIAIFLKVLIIILTLLSASVFRENKFLGILSFLLMCTIAISTGSRWGTICLIIWGTICFLRLDKKLYKVLFVIIYIPLVIFFSGYILILRGNDEHGLLPYIAMIGEWDLIQYGIFFNVYYATIMGFFATSATQVQSSYITLSDLFISLNPMPGTMAGWYDIAHRMALGKNIPYTSIGQLSAFPIIFYCYYTILGYIFSYIESFIIRLILNNKEYQAILLYLITIMYIPFSFEYTLRQAHRFVYYSLALSIFMHMIHILKYKKKLY